MMKHSDFSMGTVFWTGSGKWRCTDIGTRTIVAIHLDPVEVVQGPSEKEIYLLTEVQAAEDGWFDGPPYAVGESVFDENDLEGCYFTQEEANL